MGKTANTGHLLLLKVILLMRRLKLFDKRRHYPLDDITWDPKVANDAIKSILNDAVSTYSAEEGWPQHPMDDGGLRGSFYFGSGGVLWAANWLNRKLGNQHDFDVLPFLDVELEQHQKSIKFMPYPDSASYLFGTLPLLMLQYQCNPSPELSDRIFSEISKNNTQPVRELMWGIAGSLIGTLFMHKWSNDSKWIELFAQQADLLIADMEMVPGVGYMWNPELYGRKAKYLGPVHGFTGNLLPLIKGKHFLSQEIYEEVCNRSIETCLNTALQTEDYVNWPAVFDPDSSGLPPVQHCHGAAGMVTVLSELPKGNQTFETTLEKAAELVWHMGALKKGSNLCHGTGGNVYTFLKMYKRTENKTWLNRARTFAMTAIEQTQRSTLLYQQGRYSLWTGDIGFAIFLYNCINATADFPTIDTF